MSGEEADDDGAEETGLALLAGVELVDRWSVGVDDSLVSGVVSVASAVAADSFAVVTSSLEALPNKAIADGEKIG